MFIWLLLLTSVKGTVFTGCGSIWPTHFYSDKHIEEPKWLAQYQGFTDETNCTKFQGILDVKQGTYRFMVVFNGPMNIHFNKKEVFHSHQTHKQRVVHFKYNMNEPVNVRMTGDIVLFDWKPFSLKIYLYSLPSKFNTDLENDPECLESMFAAEPRLFHSLKNDHLTRTKNPLEADYFYVPVYSLCKKQNQRNAPDKPFGRTLIQDAAIFIKTQFPFWSRHHGQDHIFTHLHDFGPCYTWYEAEEERKRQDNGIENAIGILYGGDYSTKCYRPSMDIVVPPFVKDIRRAIQPQKDWLAYFQGVIVWKNIERYSGGIRKILFDMYRNSSTIHVYENYAHSREEYVHNIQRSTFSLCLPGMALWSPRIVESLVYGSIPVIIADDIVLPFEDQLEWSHFSLRISERDATTPFKLEHILRRISSDRIQHLSSNGRAAVAKLLYDNPPWETHSAYKTLLSALRLRMQ